MKVSHIKEIHVGLDFNEANRLRGILNMVDDSVLTEEQKEFKESFSGTLKEFSDKVRRWNHES